ncbi:MAG TPA: metallophosphoesterase [Candidatus Dormibacteraeota bacterium]|nr:metallophosphoesterase [Candidatus Dormibacteraeota bacterium]
MATRTALGLGIIGGLVVIGLAALVVAVARPSPTFIPTASPGATAAPTAAASTTVPTAGPVASAPARPSAAPGGSVNLIAAGDIASCAVTGDSATAKLVESLPGTVAALGDDAYDSGTASEYSQCYAPTWGAFLDRTRPVPGNHEYVTRGAAGYFGYFGSRAGDPKLGYYAYDLGTWRLYALNSNCSEIGGCGPGSAEVAWLQADLAAHPTRCVLAYWHHPRFSSGLHGSNAFVAGLWDTLEAAGAEIVLSGHDHDYERFAPMSVDGRVDAVTGITEFVVGTGGRSHYPFNAILPASLVRDDTTFGVLDLTLSPGRWSSTFVPVAGATFTDSASGTCH